MISSAAFPVVGVSEPKKSQSLRDYAADDGFVVYRQDLPGSVRLVDHGRVLDFLEAASSP